MHPRNVFLFSDQSNGLELLRNPTLLRHLTMKPSNFRCWPSDDTLFDPLFAFFTLLFLFYFFVGGLVFQKISSRFHFFRPLLFLGSIWDGGCWLVWSEFFSGLTLGVFFLEVSGRICLSTIWTSWDKKDEGLALASQSWYDASLAVASVFGGMKKVSSRLSLFKQTYFSTNEKPSLPGLVLTFKFQDLSAEHGTLRGIH